MQAQSQLEVNKNNAAHVPEYVTIQGTIQRVVFHNPENGYCVLSVTVKQDDSKEDWFNDDLKLTGHLAAPREGDEYRFTGTFITHPKFGKQLKFTDAELLLPVGKSGIARYLSQITAGIGVKRAEQIVAALGENALEQIRENPDSLNHPDLKFLTEEQKSAITADLTKNSIQAELAALICGPGIGMGTVHKILNTLGRGREALDAVKENPYCLCDEVFGIGFKLADAIALKVGIPKNSPFRVDSAFNYVLREAAGEGHCYLTPTLIVEALLGTVETEKLTGCRIRGAREKKKEGIIAYSGVGIEEIKNANQRLIDQGRCVREGDCVYGKELWLAEIIVAERVKTLISQEPKEIAGMDLMIKDLEERDSLEYAPEQKEAVARALQSPLSIITGGPGTGKTTVVNAIVEIYERLYHKGHRVYLAAPTGRAAKRMGEATSHEAMTIHRLLGYNPNAGGDGFTYGIDEPLPGPGLIIVDEMSMTDIELASKIFAAVEVTEEKMQHQVVLVGDANQLPSVGAGSVLRDLIASGKIPTTRLQYNYRQANGSKIAEYAHLVCKGEMLQLKSAGDFEFVHADSGDDAASTINFLAETYIKAKGLEPLDWMVLTPMKKNSCGVKALNQSLREIINPVALNPDKETKTLGNFRLNDRVIVIRNNYQLAVFNGDVGIVTDIEGGKLTVNFGNREVEFTFEHLELLTLAYAITIHKAQGSEFELVILAATSQHYVMLTREIFYTGLTRASKKMVLVGDTKSVAMCVKNNKTVNRYSRLAERVKNEN